MTECAVLIPESAVDGRGTMKVAGRCANSPGRGQPLARGVVMADRTQHNNEVPYLTHCRFCDEERSSTNPGQPWGRLRLVCQRHWDALWGERRPHRDKSVEAREASVRWHWAVWPDRIYKIVSVGNGTWVYREDQARFARKRIEKLFTADKPVLLFYADVMWEEGLDEIPDPPADALGAVDGVPALSQAEQEIAG